MTFKERFEEESCAFVTLDPTEMKFYSGCGWAVARINEDKIADLIYLKYMGKENLKDFLNKITSDTPYWLGMCSSGQFCEPEKVVRESVVCLAKIARLHAEETFIDPCE